MNTFVQQGCVTELLIENIEKPSVVLIIQKQRSKTGQQAESKGKKVIHNTRPET